MTIYRIYKWGDQGLWLTALGVWHWNSVELGTGWTLKGVKINYKRVRHFTTSKQLQFFSTDRKSLRNKFISWHEDSTACSNIHFTAGKTCWKLVQEHHFNSLGITDLSTGSLRIQALQAQVIEALQRWAQAPFISHGLNVKSMLLTKLSNPPPRRSTAPICMEDTWGTLTGGPRSRLSRSPRRSPCDGMTCGCSRFVVAVVPTGLSPASVLQAGRTRRVMLSRLWSLISSMVKAHLEVGSQEKPATGWSWPSV